MYTVHNVVELLYQALATGKRQSDSPVSDEVMETLMWELTGEEEEGETGGEEDVKAIQSVAKRAGTE